VHRRYWNSCRDGNRDVIGVRIGHPDTHTNSHAVSDCSTDCG
jgi:hypothetical protein